jgi:hypothetical protein
VGFIGFAMNNELMFLCSLTSLLLQTQMKALVAFYDFAANVSLPEVLASAIANLQAVKYPPCEFEMFGLAETQESSSKGSCVANSIVIGRYYMSRPIPCLG